MSPSGKEAVSAPALLDLPAASDPSAFPLSDSQVETATVQEIRDVCMKAPPLREKEMRMSRISENTVVKIGAYIYMHEARNMEFVAANTSIRVPRVIRTFDVPVRNRKTATAIVMEYVHGRPLDECWDELSEERRENVCQQVADAVRQLQSLEVERPGPIGGGPSQSYWFRDRTGPFKSRRHLEDWYTAVLELCKSLNKADQDAPPFTGKFKKLVMTHLDLAPRNIILEEGDKVCLLDWDFAGAYPPHFERATLMKQWRDGEFTSRVLAAIPTHEKEIEELMTVEYAMKHLGLYHVLRDTFEE